MTQPTNPLLDNSPLPCFDAIRPEHIEPGIQELLAKLDTQLVELEQRPTPTWTGLVEPLERIDDELSGRWRIITHLTAVANSEPLRAAYAEVEPKLVRFAVRFGQSRPVYDALCTLRDGLEWVQLDEAQQRIVTLLIRDAPVGRGQPRQRRA